MIGSWFHSIEYTVSYYFDLSGYADMAIGLGMMFNIAIPHNLIRRTRREISRITGDGGI